MDKLLRLQFYANSKIYQNKLFSFKIKNEDAANRLLASYISSGNFIKAAFIQEYHLSAIGKVIVDSNYMLDSKVLNDLNLLYQ